MNHSSAVYEGVSKQALDRALEVKDAILNKRPIRAIASLDKNMLLGEEKNRTLLSIFLRTPNWENIDEKKTDEGRITVGNLADNEVNKDPLASFKLLLR